ncbi:hypothetical protein [Saccharothrix syringae]|uniref:Uncharacterized protein n=1 Tax=Saccharothrix syringae TaxID=103733 RepID=A0A5Q0HC05_SACSY|nr:hypothetical protein [Saccharothrix syringae]QFZ23808.1 hypothetical protein EKG83_45870 [Saccharothrix syringae]
MNKIAKAALTVFLVLAGFAGLIAAGLTLLVCLNSTCGTIEADPTFVVVGVEDTRYHINVVKGRPADLRADNWHQSYLDKKEFDTEVREGDHVICHLTEDDDVVVTACRKTVAPTT